MAAARTEVQVLEVSFNLGRQHVEDTHARVCRQLCLQTIAPCVRWNGVTGVHKLNTNIFTDIAQAAQERSKQREFCGAHWEMRGETSVFLQVPLTCTMAQQL